jgi:hypothetical protein
MPRERLLRSTGCDRFIHLRAVTTRGFGARTGCECVVHKGHLAVQLFRGDIVGERLQATSGEASSSEGFELGSPRVA